MFLKMLKISRKTATLASLFNRAFRIATLLKIVSNTSVFLKNLRNLLEHLIWRKSVNDCFWNLFKFHQDSPFLITYMSGSNWYICFSFCIIIYSFVYQCSFVIIRSSRPVVFCKKGVLTNFAKFTRKHLSL